ncbi:uncharacterized protein H6S33_002328 [Morchella sextelata]|uniref:uncharacterized protein n=1 Tax=Morchella sextelata TaxID=1174677 RepID=UPI001D04E6DD|nr:uncharacterized protein H6S33_002328 [Morchella sextelata]KAH0608276.1 hypothetical protein H6S33_002328 [Morchella sextelata]
MDFSTLSNSELYWNPWSSTEQSTIIATEQPIRTEPETTENISTTTTVDTEAVVQDGDASIKPDDPPPRTVEEKEEEHNITTVDLPPQKDAEEQPIDDVTPPPQEIQEPTPEPMDPPPLEVKVEAHISPPTPPSPPPQKKPFVGIKSFRVQGIPKSWAEDKFAHYLASQGIDPQNFTASLYPSCSGADVSQTAVLNLKLQGPPPELVKPVVENGNESVFVDVPEHVAGEKGVQFEIDTHFYDLTPLNTPEEEQDIVDIVAVTGLAGHAYGSWKSRKTQKMWLQDFLPIEPDIRRVRIMTYGYNTKLIENTVDDGMVDYRRHFIQQLTNSRDSPEKKSRPIIFIGHSLGGILIAQALVHSKNIQHSRHILDATHAVIFFGTPHKGLKVSQLEDMIQDIEKNSDSTRLHLLSQLKESSQSHWLEEQRDHLADVWANIGIVSFYETETTPTVAKSESGVYGRFGEEVEMVTRVSAQMGFPNEFRIPIGRSHTEMVKFPSKIDPAYRSLVSHVVTFLHEIKSIQDRKRSIKKFKGRDRKAERDFLKNLAVNLLLKR